MNQAPPAKKDNKTFLYVLIGFFALLAVSFVFVVGAVGYLFSKASGKSFGSGSNSIDLIEISGPIYDSDDVVRRIKHFKDGPQKGLILRLNSPGGVVAPSQEIYSEILAARKEKKVVIASMSDMAASGAYYIASACDAIVADPGTLTGSIGVIAEIPDASGLLKKVGLNMQTIKSGKFKDTGTYGRPLNAEDRAYLQGTINDVYQQFLHAVVDSRKDVFKERLAKLLGKKPEAITDGQVLNFVTSYADGRVLTGEKAYELGFIDQLGNYYDAIHLMAEKTGIEGEPSIHLDEPVKWDQMMDQLVPFSFLSKTSSEFRLEYMAF